MSYLGYPNYETWNIELWFDNDEPLYQDKMHFIRTHVCNEKNVKEFCLKVFPNGTPDMEDVTYMEKVDYEHLAEMWETEDE